VVDGGDAVLRGPVELSTLVGRGDQRLGEH
jgi:hypothetical protein